MNYYRFSDYYVGYRQINDRFQLSFKHIFSIDAQLFAFIGIWNRIANYNLWLDFKLWTDIMFKTFEKHWDSFQKSTDRNGTPLRLYDSPLYEDRAISRWLQFYLWNIFIRPIKRIRCKCWSIFRISSSLLR